MNKKQALQLFDEHKARKKMANKILQISTYLCRNISWQIEKK